MILRLVWKKKSSSQGHVGDGGWAVRGGGANVCSRGATVSNQRSSGKKRRSKSERREVGATDPIGPCLPIILCTTLSYSDLAAERKWRTIQVTPSEFMKLRTLQQVFNLTCGSILVSPRQELRKEKR